MVIKLRLKIPALDLVNLREQREDVFPQRKCRLPSFVYVLTGRRKQENRERREIGIYLRRRIDRSIKYSPEGKKSRNREYQDILDSQE